MMLKNKNRKKLCRNLYDLRNRVRLNYNTRMIFCMHISNSFCHGHI